jgi:hypothetical protein
MGGMSDHEAKALALAEKIAAKAEEALAGLDREMAIMKWPPEFRKIMWDAVAHLAARYAGEIDG